MFMSGGDRIELGSTDGCKTRDHIFQPQHRWIFPMNRWDVARRVCGDTTGYFWRHVGWNQSLRDIFQLWCGNHSQTRLRSLRDIFRYLWRVVWMSLWLQNQVFLNPNLIFSGPELFLAFLTWYSCYLLTQKLKVNSINQKRKISYWTNLIQGFNI